MKGVKKNIKTRDSIVAQHIDLCRRFPIAKRWIVKRCLAWMVGVVPLFVGLLICTQFEGVYSELATAAALLAAGAAAALVMGKIVYEMLSRSHYYYAVEGSNFVIEKGIVLKQRGCFPLAQIADVYINRSVVDFIFGLYNLNISTPTAHSGEFARIDGLRRRPAIALQNELLGIVYAGSGDGYLESEADALDQDLPFEGAHLPHSGGYYA